MKLAKNKMRKNNKQAINGSMAIKTPAVTSELLHQGFALHQKGDLLGAGEFYSQILRLDPLHFDALHLSGLIAAKTEQFDIAAELITKAISINPNNAPAYCNIGNVYLNAKKYSLAIENYSKALELNPRYEEAFYSRGLAYQKLGKLDSAQFDYETALKINSKHIGTLTNLGNVLQLQKKYDEAIGRYGQAIALNQNFPEPFNNRGNLYHEQKRYKEALEDFSAALAINPNYPEALSNSANSLFALKQYQQALDTYNKAIAASPNYAEAFHNRGNLFRELKYYALAQKDYERGLLLKPEYDYLRGVHFATKMNLCDWSNFDEEWKEIARQIPVMPKVIAPFMVLPVSDSMALQRRVSEQWVAEKYLSQLAPNFHIQEAKGRKIRIGYFSADFHDHATMYLMAELFELHDKSKFETIGFSFGPDSQDSMRSRAIAALDQFYDVRTKTDEEVAKQARELEIDIAIDLKGFTLDSRTGIFAHRAAPIQINYLGYPGTMGAEFIDYIIADRVIIPEEFQHLYSEQVLYMPDCYQINDRKRKISDKKFTREDVRKVCRVHGNIEIT
jgi:predicted O-linked N-acetylglucosamine transferase (SPINDLY family)